MCITTALVGNLAGACSCLCLQSILSSVLWKPLRQGSPTRPSSRCPQEPPQTAKSLCNSFGARQPGSTLCNWADRDTECFGQAPLLCFALFRSSRRKSSPLLPWAVAQGHLRLTKTACASPLHCGQPCWVLAAACAFKASFRLFRGSPCGKDLRQSLAADARRNPPKKPKAFATSLVPGSRAVRFAIGQGQGHIIFFGQAPLLCFAFAGLLEEDPLLFCRGPLLKGTFG